MGKTTKKTAAKKKVRRRANPKPAMQVGQRKDLEQAEGTLRNVVEAFVEHLDDQKEAGEFSQDDLGAALLFERLGKLSGEGRKLFDSAVLEVYDEGDGALTFEAGRIVCNINSTSRRAPQWKEEAANREQALRLLAQLATDGNFAEVSKALAPYAGKFDRKKWEETVSESYDAKTSYKPKLTEGM